MESKGTVQADRGSAPNLESPTSMSGQIELQSEHVAKREISAHTNSQLYVCQFNLI